MKTKTYITTAHEEDYSNKSRTKSRTIGVLLNLNENYQRIDSLIYIYHKGMYIFFDTIIGMTDYLLYGRYSAMARAYLSEDDFDRYYDAEYVDGEFTDLLKWS
ncbi:MAG: hypothetical protein PF487_12750 [Bacteroidales bacterium]|jgi:hypothetical protein|nr:hypothetical protein [Bacteroidales bacterium]